MDNELIITRWCKISTSDIIKLIKYFAKQPISVQIKILKMHREVLFKNKNYIKKQSIDISIGSYIAMILSIKYYYALEQKLTKLKFEDLSAEELRDISIIQVQKFDTKFVKQKKRDRLKHYWSIVKYLKLQDKSFRKISHYLEYKYKFKISHSEIFKAWQELENYEYK
jgi:hypothetical protein